MRHDGQTERVNVQFEMKSASDAMVAFWNNSHIAAASTLVTR